VSIDPRLTQDGSTPGVNVVPAWWGAGPLARIWGVIAERLERRGLDAAGRVRLADLDRAERHALGDLVGAPVTRDRLVVDLSELDERLRLRSGTGVVGAAERVLGRPLVDRRAGRSARRDRLVESEQAALSWLAEHPELDWPWVAEWVSGMRRDGTLTRSPEPTRLVLSALTVLLDRRDALAGNPAAPPVARTQLAARTAYDAHALDPDRALSSAVLRAVATRAGREMPADAAGRRELWESVEVLPDSVSSTCLVWNLRTREPMTRAPRHLTWWDLQRGQAPQGGQALLVCENPRVLEAVAELGPLGVGVVCTMGRPNLVVQELLTRARASDCSLTYHGDFDWPGIAMANAALTRFSAHPWLMSVSSYEAAPASLALQGAPVEPLWDAELGSAMRNRGLAVHEEVVLPVMLDALMALPHRSP
jgi:uncharacterized protein (TIGR02679 family)